MNCYSCEQAATNACKRCAKPYCADHGNATYCSDCLQPASAMPSFNLYRGALLVMLVGTAVAVFLLVRPPGESKEAAPVVVGRVTPTAVVEGGETPDAGATSDTGTPPQSAGTPDADTTPGADETPAADATPGRTPTAEPTSDAAFREYVVQDGDSLFGIAEATIAPGDDIVAYAEAIANLNGWTVDTAELIVGNTILLPPLPE